MTHHRKRQLWRLILLIVLIGAAPFALGYSKKSDSSSGPAPAEVKAPSPPPTTGTVEGRLLGQKGHKPLAGWLIVLCQIAKEPACNLRAQLKATTDADGAFSVKDVPPGRYTVTHTKFSDKAEARIKEDMLIDPTTRPVEVVSGTVIDIGMDGRLANVRGATINPQTGLTFEFERGKLLIVEVRSGVTAPATFQAFGL